MKISILAEVMNFLAHIYLSGNDDDLKLGNFIGDYVKGKNYLNYRDKIQEGILLHRKIDKFTDNHPLNREASTFFKKEYGRYSGIVLDMAYDHFLAQNWDSFSKETLREFSQNAHSVFMRNYLILPSRVKTFLPFLIKNRRLESYATERGLIKALEIMAHYTSLPDKQGFALEVIRNKKHDLLNYFFAYMKELIQYIETDIGIKIEKPDQFLINSGI